MTSSHSLHKRAGGGGLSTGTIIVIVVVCISVFVLLMVLSFWRRISRVLRREKSAPLPPIQPLAHERDKHLQAFADRYSRPPTLYDRESSYGGVSTKHLHPGASATSLLYNSYALSSQTSLTGEDVRSVGSRVATPLSAAGDVAPASEGSFSPDEVDPPPDSMEGIAVASGAISTSPSIPMSDTMSYASQATSDSMHPLAGPSDDSSPQRRVPRARPGVRPSASRPLSIASSVRTTQTTRSVSMIRGAPHSMHSNVQIVLPAPLAPDSYPFAEAADPRYSRSSSAFSVGDDRPRSAVVDQWVSVGRPTSSVPSMPPRSMNADRRSSSRAPSKLSQSISVHGTAPAMKRRSQSQPQIDAAAVVRARQPAPPLPTARRAPSVPRLPSAYSSAYPGEPSIAEHEPFRMPHRSSPEPMDKRLGERRGRPAQRQSTVPTYADLANIALQPQRYQA